MEQRRKEGDEERAELRQSSQRIARIHPRQRSQVTPSMCKLVNDSANTTDPLV